MSSKKYKEITKPWIYICSPDQFDFRRAKQLGYVGQLYYLNGQRNDSDTDINWLGYDSKDVNETFNEVFVYNYTGLDVQDEQAKLNHI